MSDKDSRRRIPPEHRSRHLGICIVLSMMGVIASECGQSERAARLFGSGGGTARGDRSVINVNWRAIYGRSPASARGALGEEAFAALWAESER
jgi:hypothetical protein